MENKEKMINLALGYLKRGWSVIPCGKDKVPSIPWKEFQTRYATEEEVRSWFEKYPEAQVGIVTGKISGITVVDVEGKDPETGEMGDPSFLPQETMIVSTGGKGLHYYYVFGNVRNKARIKKLIDFRCEGGYVVAPGSTSNKGPYSVIQDAPLQPFPHNLFPEVVDTFSLPSKTPSFNFEKRELKPYYGFGKGQRNEEMAKYIGYVLTQIHPADWETEAWGIITSANMLNTPPLASRELSTTFESIKGTERRNNPLGRSSAPRGAPGAMSSGPWKTANDETPIILEEGEDEIKHIADVAEEQELDQDDFYPLQMPCFDDVICGGVSPGDLVVVAGQTGHGKTTLVQDWTISLIRGPKKPKSLWFSYEVLPTHLWKKFREMGMSREDCAFIPCKHSSGNVAWVEQKIKEGKEKFGIKVVMIDHLGFLLPKTSSILGGSKLSSNYSTFLTQVVRDLKSIAIREEIIIFLPVHMRKPERGNKRSDSDDIKDSSGIGQESDLVFLIEREKNKDMTAKSYFTDTTKITLAKNRKTGTTVVANFNMVKGRFAYDDTDDKANDAFDKLGKALNEEGAKQEALPIPPPVVAEIRMPYVESDFGVDDEGLPEETWEEALSEFNEFIK